MASGDEKEVQQLKTPYFIIKGQGMNRFSNAVQLIDAETLAK